MGLFSIVSADLSRKANRALRDAQRSQASGDQEQAERDYAASRAYRRQAAEAESAARRDK